MEKYKTTIINLGIFLFFPKKIKKYHLQWGKFSCFQILSINRLKEKIQGEICLTASLPCNTNMMITVHNSCHTCRIKNWTDTFYSNIHERLFCFNWLKISQVMLVYWCPNSSHQLKSTERHGLHFITLIVQAPNGSGWACIPKLYLFVPTTCDYKIYSNF